MDNGTMMVWYPHVIDNETGKVTHGLGYFATLWDAEDMAWECEGHARRTGHNISVKIIRREVPAGEARFWISTNRF